MLSFRRAVIAAWQHAVKIVPGFGRSCCESYRKAVVCRKFCPTKGRSGGGGVSVSTGKSPADRIAEDGKPGSAVRTGPVSALPEGRGAGVSDRRRTDQADCTELVLWQRSGNRARRRCFAKGIVTTQVPELIRSRVHEPYRLLGRRVCLRGTQSVGRKTCAPGASFLLVFTQITTESQQVMRSILCWARTCRVCVSAKHCSLCITSGSLFLDVFCAKLIGPPRNVGGQCA